MTNPIESGQQPGPKPEGLSGELEELYAARQQEMKTVDEGPQSAETKMHLYAEIRERYNPKIQAIIDQMNAK